MANTDGTGGGGNGFLAFLVGGLLVAVIVVGVFVYNNGGMGQREADTIEVNVPDVKINTPDIDMPDVTPPPQAPEPAPAQ